MPTSVRTRFAAFLVLALLALPSLGLAAGVRIKVAPETLTVAPGDTFTVRLLVPEPGASFNGYEAVVSYDPSALHFIPRAQAAQEGASLSGACGNTFYLFASAGDSMTTTDILLCNQLFLTGPDTLLTLRFVATGLEGRTYIRLRHVEFYRAGLYVDPVVSSDAAIAVGVVLGVPPSVAALSQSRLHAVPNPSRGSLRFQAEGAGAGEHEIRIFDAGGRLVRRLELGSGDRLRAAAWDGRDTEGRLAPPGIYTALLRTPGRVLHTVLVRLP